MTIVDLSKLAPSESGPGSAEANSIEAEPPARIGANELGRIDVEPRAVEKIASLAAGEVTDASGAVGRTRGVPGASYLGLRRSPFERLPKVSAEVDGDHVFLGVELSVRWPMPVARVTEEVRRHLVHRVGALLGLDVREVNIEIVDLVTESTAARVI